VAVTKWAFWGFLGTTWVCHDHPPDPSD